MTLVRRVAFPALVGALLLAGGLQMAAGYRFYRSENVLGPFLHGEGDQYKIRWDPEVWGPGTTMTVAVLDDPRWMEAFDFIDGMADVRRLVSEATADWSGISSADIRWEVGEAPATGEETITVWIKDLGEHCCSGMAWTNRSKIGRGDWQIRRCKVWLNEPDLRGFDRRIVRGVLKHELGHCLGLQHHAEYPNLWWPFDNWASMWGERSIMGVTLDEPTHIPEGNPQVLQHTERIGASLLWPAPGWLGTTGAIYGTVLGADFGSEMAAVALLAARIGPDGRPRDAVTRVTNQWGQFTVEGLAPGEYVLMLYGADSSEESYGWQNVARIAKTIRLDPVRVRAGERVGPIVLTARLRSGEDVP